MRYGTSGAKGFVFVVVGYGGLGYANYATP
jgi:hypothetical protein